MSFSAVQTAMAEAGYMASDDLAVALHLAISLQRPILLEGAAGVGKTEVARVLATVQKTKLIRLQCYEGLDAAQAIYEWNYQRQLLAIRSSAEAGETGSTVEKRIFSEEFLLERPLLAAIRQPQAPVLLIDEIDKADIEFPNDLLVELDRMEFFVYETGETIKAKQRPIIIITSNNEKELPDAFLRRCFFHYIRFPEPEVMESIINVHYPDIRNRLVAEAMRVFYDIREAPGLKKKPSTSELIDWLKLLMADDIPDEVLKNRDQTKAIPPLYGALVKNEQDVQLLERLAFMHRRESNQ